ncbi:MAG TPA: hypothetical protein VHE12_01150 [bacterium]|nr:hypothetical protein [bacterium]
MRLQTFLGRILVVLWAVPACLCAKPFNEMTIDRLGGTIMDQPADGSKPYALGTTSVVNKGDVLTVYDQGWVILKTHNGDRIGLDGNTVAVVDEFYIEGPDRQVRFLLQKGTMLFKVNGRDSRQSFFEINTGGEVTSINDTRCILVYDPSAAALDVKFIAGKMTVLDKDNEEKFKVENSERTWKDGKMMAEDPTPLDQLDVVNFNKFFEGEPRLKPRDNNFLLPGAD